MEIIGIGILLALLVVVWQLARIIDALIAIATNQGTASDIAREDNATTASVLVAADSSRQTDTGDGTAVNTKQK